MRREWDGGPIRVERVWGIQFAFVKVGPSHFQNTEAAEAWSTYFARRLRDEFPGSLNFLVEVDENVDERVRVEDASWATGTISEEALDRILELAMEPIPENVDQILERRQ